MGFTIHEGASFVVSAESGDVEPESEQGYYHLDTRFLSGCELTLDGRSLVFQSATAPDWHEGFHFLTNPALDGAPRSGLGVVVHRYLASGLHEDVAVESFADHEVSFSLELDLACDFAYILTAKQKAMKGSSSWSPHVAIEHPARDRILFRLEHAEIPHETEVRFSRPADELTGGRATFRVRLARRERFEVGLVVLARLGDDRTSATPRPAGSREPRRARRRRELAEASCSIETDHQVLGAALAQAQHDLQSLRIKAEDAGGDEGRYAIAAGIPWYMDLFGRDSLIACYESMVSEPSATRGTIEALSRLQGTKVDPVSVEAPGKILHEYRRGPMPEAARKLIPKYPYYGTVDATPLFLITLSEYARWSGDLDFVRAHWGNVERALGWMQDYGDLDGDGLLEYELRSAHGLVNQGWKDSSDSIRFRDGRIAEAPIALVEVQGYQIEALLRVAELCEHVGKAALGRELERRAAPIREHTLEAFWLDDRRTFAEALDGKKQRVDSLTSNPGHLLWCGVPDADRSKAVADSLLSDDLFSGYGIRTMGDREGGYNPLSYHDGSVWPHDSTLALAGLVRTGELEHAARLAEGLLNALGRFERHQPPEVFCGYRADRFPAPVRYPNANRPQAWASASVLLLARCIAGLEVNALAHEVRARPLTVPGLTHLGFRGLRIGGAKADLLVDWRGGRPRARFLGLDSSWRQHTP